MAEGVLAAVLLVLGFLLLFGGKYVASQMVRAFTDRIAAVALLAAGTALTQGRAGQVTSWLVDSLNRAGASLSMSAFDVDVTWLVPASLFLIWLAGFLPGSVVRLPLDRWLSITGLFLGPFAAGIPGEVGTFIRNTQEFLTSLIVDLVTAGVT